MTYPDLGHKLTRRCNKIRDSTSLCMYEALADVGTRNGGIFIHLPFDSLRLNFLTWSSSVSSSFLALAAPSSY